MALFEPVRADLSLLSLFRPMLLQVIGDKGVRGGVKALCWVGEGSYIGVNCGGADIVRG